MRVQSNTKSIGTVIRDAVIQLNSDNSGKRDGIDRPRRYLGDEIAALDEHWVFRKTQ